MAEKDHYHVRREADGTIRNIIAQSPRGAMRLFVARYGPPVGERFAVRRRLSGEEWEWYSVTSRGIRHLS